MKNRPLQAPGLHTLSHLRLIEHVLGLLFALHLQLIKRRLGDKYLSLHDKIEHLPEEKRQKKRPYMGPVNIGIGH